VFYIKILYETFVCSMLTVQIMATVRIFEVMSDYFNVVGLAPEDIFIERHLDLCNYYFVFPVSLIM
jgi:hypothetical protein